MTMLNDVYQREGHYKVEEFLSSCVDGPVASTGPEFLQELVRCVAGALGTRYAFVGYLLPESRIRRLAFWKGDGYMEQIEYSLEGTPCLKAIEGETCHYTQDVQQLFPRDPNLITLGVSGYLAAPLRDPKGNVLGHLVAMDVNPLVLTDEKIDIIKLFGERAGAELYRQVVETSLREREETLRVIAEGTVAQVGVDFFASLVKYVATALRVDYAYISHLAEDGTRFCSKAAWGKGQSLPPFDVPARGPCETVLKNVCIHHPSRLRQLYPHVQLIQEIGVESYCGVPLVDSKGAILGHFAIMDSGSMPNAQLVRSILTIFATRTAAELERVQMDTQLRAHEARLRDLFEEAPIAYVYEGLDSKFLRANKMALQMLGITPDQVHNLYRASLIPETPDAQQRLKKTFDSIGKGGESSGILLELRRKDNGKPLWIKWWSRPDPSSTYTHTMFIDVTQQVLMEQEKAQLEAQNVYLQEEIKENHNLEELIGSSTSLKKVLEHVGRVAPTDLVVLLTGEIGTGKGLIARAIHHLSPRKHLPLVTVNCTTIPPGLLESELFGHEKGAFTGALTKKIGCFEASDKGTIFLEAIDELPLDLQSKLLRVLQEGMFERMGGTQTLTANVRVIVAANRNLEHLSKYGRYQPNLYHWLNLCSIHVPALRERNVDIPLLTQYFVRKHAAHLGKRINRIPESIVTAFQQYSWPGNIRELEFVIGRAVILSEGPELEPIDWFSSSDGKTSIANSMTLE